MDSLSILNNFNNEFSSGMNSVCLNGNSPASMSSSLSSDFDCDDTDDNVNFWSEINKNVQPHSHNNRHCLESQLFQSNDDCESHSLFENHCSGNSHNSYGSQFGDSNAHKFSQSPVGISQLHTLNHNSASFSPPAHTDYSQRGVALNKPSIAYNDAPANHSGHLLHFPQTVFPMKHGHHQQQQQQQTRQGYPQAHQQMHFQQQMQPQMQYSMHPPARQQVVQKRPDDVYMVSDRADSTQH